MHRVLPQQGVPAGLEVHLSVDGSGDRRARIPDPWRLQLYLGRARGFLRLDVGRRTRVREVEAAAAQAASSHVRHGAAAAAAVRVCGARLLDGGAALDPEQTAEEAALFSRRGRLDRGGTIRSARTYDSGNTPSRPPLRPRAHPDGASRSGQQTKTSPSASVRQRRSAVANASDERTTSTSSSPGLSRSSDSALPSESDDPCRASDDVETTEAASAMAA